MYSTRLCAPTLKHKEKKTRTQTNKSLLSAIFTIYPNEREDKDIQPKVKGIKPLARKSKIAKTCIKKSEVT